VASRTRPDRPRQLTVIKHHLRDPKTKHELLTFVGVAALVIMTPGPDTAVTIRSTLASGRRGGVLTATGVVTGQACWTIAAAAGITALLVASEPAFLAVRLIGGGYLIWLGVHSLIAASRGGARLASATPAPQHSSLYRQGLLSDLSNPKMAAFFSSLLPQFGTSFLTMLGFGLTFCLLTWLWLALYANAFALLDRALARRSVRRAFEALTGIVLIGLGVRLAVEPRR
jgi:threonine/homoserine/homoserine lactone efflux protein